jgi:hypothetical protein
VGGLGDVTWVVEGDDINFVVEVDEVNQIVTYQTQNPTMLNKHTRVEWHACFIGSSSGDVATIKSFPHGQPPTITNGGVSTAIEIFPDGHYLELSTAGVSGIFFWGNSDRMQFNFQWDFDISWVIRIPNPSALDFLRVGIGTTWGSGATPNGDGFLLEWTGGDWIAYVCASGAAFPVDTNIAGVDGGRYVLRIRRIDDVCQFWVNGAIAATIDEDDIPFTSGDVEGTPQIIMLTNAGLTDGKLKFSRMWVDMGERGDIFV